MYASNNRTGPSSAARMFHQVAVWVPNLVCNCNFVKNQQPQKLESKYDSIYNPENFRTIFAVYLTNFRNSHNVLNIIIATDIYGQPSYLVVEPSQLHYCSLVAVTSTVT
jgi:hypothetical protein